MTYKISKPMCALLRHRIQRSELTLDDRGYTHVDNVITWLKEKNSITTDQQTIENIVRDDEKQRFSIEKRNDGLYICANQGHSFQIKNLDLVEITEEDRILFPLPIVHASYKQNEKRIQRDGLLSMGRTHVHMADVNYRLHAKMMRKNSSLFVRVDMFAAISAGIPFFTSKNHVVLSPGPIPPTFLSFYSSFVEASKIENQYCGAIITSGTENVLISTSDPDVKLLMDHLSSVKQAKQDRTEASKKNPNWSNYCPYHCESGFSEVAARMNDPSTSNVFKQMFRTQFPHYK